MSLLQSTSVKKPIFRSVDASQWQKTISDSSELCSVWQINEVTEQAEIIAQPDCNRDLPSICLQSVGTKTYSNQSDHQATQQQRLASSQHLYYLLTQLNSQLIHPRRNVLLPISRCILPKLLKSLTISLRTRLMFLIKLFLRRNVVLT